MNKADAELLRLSDDALKRGELALPANTIRRLIAEKEALRQKDDARVAQMREQWQADAERKNALIGSLRERIGKLRAALGIIDDIQFQGTCATKPTTDEVLNDIERTLRSALAADDAMEKENG